MTVSYDKLTDVLYVTFSQPKHSADYVEVDGGISRTDASEERVVGLTIPFFLEKMESRESMTFPEIGPVPFSEETVQALHEARSEERRTEPLPV